MSEALPLYKITFFFKRKKKSNECVPCGYLYINVFIFLASAFIYPPPFYTLQQDLHLHFFIHCSASSVLTGQNAGFLLKESKLIFILLYMGLVWQEPGQCLYKKVSILASFNL